MGPLYTIGFTKKSLRRFVELLQDAGVDAVIDIRLRNNNQLAGFAKRDDLAFVLGLFHMAYEHIPELAPTPDILDGYRKDKDWARYVAQFQPLMVARGAETIGQDVLSRYRRPALLCSEATPERCHRRLVAEYWAEHLAPVEAPLEIVHL